MAAIDRPLERPNQWKFWVLVLLIVALLGWMLLPHHINMTKHAGKRGESNLERARNCKGESNGYLFFNPATGRYGKVCQDEFGWFVVIMNGARTVITAFPKEKLNDLTQVIRYMENAGYQWLR